MNRFSTFLAFSCCFISTGVYADKVPAAGQLLVATDEVRGPYFAQTVILLLQHDETGALGLVLNRPIDASAIESLRLHEDLATYRDSFYWGGPVSQSTVRALLRTDTPPEDAVQIFDAVHLVNMDEASLADASKAPMLRFFVGYAGWSKGQLERELAFDSWYTLPATEELVFAEDTGDIWRKLLSSRQYRAAVDRMESGVRDLIAASADDLDLSVKFMPSGAGHDAQDLALITPNLAIVKNQEAKASF